MKAHPWTICLKRWICIACCRSTSEASYFARDRITSLFKGARLIIRVFRSTEIVTVHAVATRGIIKFTLAARATVYSLVQFFFIERSLLPRISISTRNLALTCSSSLISWTLLYPLAWLTSAISILLHRAAVFTWLFSWWHL